MPFKLVGIDTVTNLFPDKVMTALKNVFAPQIGMLAAVNTSTAPTVGKIQPYNASAGNLTVTLPALSGLDAGKTILGVQKSSGDTSLNTITIAPTTGDTFDSGSTSLVLKATSELRTLQVVTIGATKYWKVVSGNTPLNYFDNTYAPVPTTGRNALTGWYHVRGWGGKADGTTNNTTVLQNITAAVLANGGGTIYFDSDPLYPKPIYRFDTWTIQAQGDIDITVTSAPDVVLKPAPLLTSDWITVASGATSTTNGTFLRRLRFRDLVMQVSGHDGQKGDKINRRGIVISQAQDITFQNVKMVGFKQGALVMTDVFDSYFNDLQIMWSGYGTDSTNYAHAMQLLGSIDCSNNNRFTNLHMEFCPLEILFDNNARMNSFINAKLEHGAGTEQNTSGISPIWFKRSMETMWTGGFLTEDTIQDIYRIRTEDTSSDGYQAVTAFNVRAAAKFSNMSFIANSLSRARWFSGYNTQFTDITAQRCNGDSGAFAFSFDSKCSFRGGSVTFATNGSNAFRLGGQQNIVETVTIVPFGDGAGASTAIFTLPNTSSLNLIRDYLITGPIGSELSSGFSSGTLGTNVVINKRVNYSTFTGGGQKNVFHTELVRLNDSSAATYTAFANGYTGQVLTVFAATGNSTIQHGNTANAIYLKGAANRTLAANETLTLINLDGVWREN